MDKNDLISRSELKKALDELFDNGGYDSGLVMNTIDNAPTVDITEEQAIDKLHETGWLPMHDKIMTKSPKDDWYITPDRQITIEEYMNSLKGENQ